MKFSGIKLLLVLISTVITMSGCADGLDLSDVNSGNQNISEISGDSMLIMGIKSDIKNTESLQQNKPGLTPQNNDRPDNPSPYLSRSLTVTVQQIQLVSAQLDADGFPVYDNSGILQTNPQLPPVYLFTGNEVVDLMDPTQLNSLLFLNSVVIPTQDIQNQENRYNKLEITVANPTLIVDCNPDSGAPFSGPNDFNRLTISGSQVYIVKSISNSTPAGGTIIANDGAYTNRGGMDFGFGSENLIASNKFLINITEPLIVNNSGLVQLVIDPLGNTPGAGVDVHPANVSDLDLGCDPAVTTIKWVVMPFGSARFVNDYIGTGTIQGGPFLLEGTIMQVVQDLNDPNSIPTSQLPYPDPGANNFWMQLQLNGSGGDIGPDTVLKPGVNAINTGINAAKTEKTDSKKHKLNKSDENKKSLNLQPQTAFTTIDPGKLDIIAYAGDLTPTLTYYYQNTGVIGNAAFGPRAVVDNGSSSGATGEFGDIALGDINGDEDLDAIVGYRGGSVILYKNLNPGWAAGSLIAGVGSDIKGVEMADFDNDGDVDVVFTSRDRSLRIYYNDGTGVFSPGPTYSLTNLPYSLAVGHLGSDSNVDVAIGERNGTIEWLDNNVGMTLKSAGSDGDGDGITGVAIKDMDNDGDGDIVAGDDYGDIVLLTRNPVGSANDFAVSVVASGPDEVMGGIELGDINNDGSVDIIAGFRSGNILWYNSAAGYSQNTVDMSIISDVTDVEVGDVDGDGDIDIVAGFSNQIIKYYANEGSGAFIPGGNETPDSSVGGRVYLEIGDVNGDGGALDITPPGNITDLTTGTITSSSIELQWTASGDDAGIGTATQYDIRYSTSLITAFNFANATAILDEPAPQETGNAETYTVMGLSEGITYYFAMKVIDDVDNTSELSNIVSELTSGAPDTTPPAIISDFAATTVSSNSVTLEWTAVGDDGLAGLASAYILKYSMSPIDDVNFDNAITANGLSAPAPPETAETFVLSGLAPETGYYFAIKTVDNANNVSEISSILQAITLASPNDTVKTFGRPILIKVNANTIITNYNNEEVSTPNTTPYQRLLNLAAIRDTATIGTAIRINGELSIEPNTFTGNGIYTSDPFNVGEGGIFTITPTHIRVIENPVPATDNAPSDMSPDPKAFQVLSNGNPTILASLSKLTTGPAFTVQANTKHKGELNPQTHQVFSQPPRPESVSMVITQMNIIQGSINAFGFPDFDVNNVAVRDIDQIHPDISLISNGNDRYELFNETQFNTIFASQTIPPDPCFDVVLQDDCVRYNMVEVVYDISSLRILTTQGEVVENTALDTPIEIRHQLLNPTPTPDYDEFIYRDIGRIYIRITTPQIFENSLNVLKIDPLGSARMEMMASILEHDMRWAIFPVGIARFDVAPQGMLIPGGPYTMEGVIVQQHDVDNSTNLPLPNTPTLSDFWVQLTEEDRDGVDCVPLCDPVGTAGAPLLMRISDTGQDSSVISDIFGNASPNVPGVLPTDEFRYLATKYDTSVNGTRVKITGEVSLTPDTSGLALGSLVIYPASSIQILEQPQ